MRTQPPVRPEPRTRTLDAAPALVPLLARGALLSPFKRPRPDAPVPATRLVLSGERIDLAHLAAYERVCGFPTGADALPVTYPHVLAFPLAMRVMAGRAFPLPLLGLVHTSIAITRHRECPANAEYELAVLVEKLAPHRRGTEATVLTEARVHGTLVWESRSTYLARHSPRNPPKAPARAHDRPRNPDLDHGQGRDPDHDHGRNPNPDSGHAPGRNLNPDLEHDQPRNPDPGHPQGRNLAPDPGHAPGRNLAPDPDHTPARNLNPDHDHDHGRNPDPAHRQAPDPRRGSGTLPALAEWRLGPDVGRRYGAVSGDRNPIHLHPLTARLFGFPRAIAHGMWTVARCLAEYGPGQAVDVRAEFRAPVPLPGAVTYAARGPEFELRSGGRVHLTGVVRPTRPRDA
ncbi:MaoC/PaaZ C-terminal domain-containing protein [Streptomyces sp. NPDC127077]|uniref:MaoC/PaaZ C-terminal domain-containing protein n=1 Tax=Streptomyces sp. NPDC127077 TaxID=3347131 RepID=UPI003661433E